MNDNGIYKWGKVKNGIPSAGAVNIVVEPNSNGKHEIIECYSGKGFESQGYIEEVSEIGYDSWTIAARHGLEYAFSLTDAFWTVTINKLQGLAFTDTTPTVIGYVTIRAFLHQIGLQLDRERVNELEEFVFSSWGKPYKELIPDFYSLTFTEFASYHL